MQTCSEVQAYVAPCWCGEALQDNHNNLELRKTRRPRAFAMLCGHMYPSLHWVRSLSREDNCPPPTHTHTHTHTQHTHTTHTHTTHTHNTHTHNTHTHNTHTHNTHTHTTHTHTTHTHTTHTHTTHTHTTHTHNTHTHTHTTNTHTHTQARSFFASLAGVKNMLRVPVVGGDQQWGKPTKRLDAIQEARCFEAFFALLQGCDSTAT